jgi:four helix bundle protein
VLHVARFLLLSLTTMPKHFQELECWQLADRLRSEVYAICAIEQVAHCWKFCNSFTDAAGSVCRNISEGFARKSSANIVQFFGYALGSIAEVQDHLIECKAQKRITPEHFQRLWDLAEHTKATCINFQKPHQARRQASRGSRTTGDNQRCRARPRS